MVRTVGSLSNRIKVGTVKGWIASTPIDRGITQMASFGFRDVMCEDAIGA